MASSNLTCNGSDGIGLMGRLMMVDVANSGDGAKVSLYITEMCGHGGPGTLDGWATVPETKIILKEMGFAKMTYVRSII